MEIKVILIILIIIVVISYVLYSGEKYDKIYPLCCDECKKRAGLVSNHYKTVREKGLPVIKIIEEKIVKNKPSGHIKDSPNGYLVMKFEDFKPVNDVNLQNITQKYEKEHYYFKKIDKTDVGLVDNNPVVINLDNMYVK